MSTQYLNITSNYSGCPGYPLLSSPGPDYPWPDQYSSEHETFLESRLSWQINLYDTLNITYRNEGVSIEQTNSEMEELGISSRRIKFYRMTLRILSPMFKTYRFIMRNLWIFQDACSRKTKNFVFKVSTKVIGKKTTETIIVNMKKLTKIFQIKGLKSY